MIYAFLSDTATHKLPSVGNSAYSNINQGVGYLSERSANFFLDGNVVTDIRDYTDRYVEAVDNGVTKTYPKGKMSLFFDMDKHASTLFDNLDIDKSIKLFNIIEYAIYNSAFNDTVVNTALLADTGSYGGYVDGSLIRTATESTIDVTTELSTYVNQVVRNWVQFTFNDGSSNLEFKIYFNEALFQSEYPYTSIMQVIPPCDPTSFISMSSYANIYDALSKSADYVADQLNSSVAPNDHSGVVNYKTAYDGTDVSVNYDFSFSILYKGQLPSQTDAKEAIKAYLLDTNIATETIWKELFPELWSTGGFYIIPLWDQIHSLTLKDIYKNMTHTTTSINKVKSLLSAFPSVFIDTNNTIFGVSAMEALLVGVPSTDNEDDLLRLDLIHPSYQAIDADSSNWFDQTAVTREFNEALNIRIGLGLGSSGSEPTETKQGKLWWKFTINGIEYFILTPEGYGV